MNVDARVDEGAGGVDSTPARSRRAVVNFT